MATGSHGRLDATCSPGEQECVDKDRSFRRAQAEPSPWHVWQRGMRRYIRNTVTVSAAANLVEIPQVGWLRSGVFAGLSGFPVRFLWMSQLGQRQGPRPTVLAGLVDIAFGSGSSHSLYVLRPASILATVKICFW